MLRVIPRMSGDIGILQRVKISEQALLIGLAVLNLFVCCLSMFVACIWLLLFVALVFYCFTFFAFFFFFFYLLRLFVCYLSLLNWLFGCFILLLFGFLSVYLLVACAPFDDTFNDTMFIVYCNPEWLLWVIGFDAIAWADKKAKQNFGYAGQPSGTWCRKKLRSELTNILSLSDIYI